MASQLMDIEPYRVYATEKYCHDVLFVRAFQRHRYFACALKADGGIELTEFLQRYQTFLARVPVKNEGAGRRVEGLTQREKTILLSRAGAEGGYKTLDEIAGVMGVTGARIGQLHDRSLRRLAHRHTRLLDALYLNG